MHEHLSKSDLYSSFRGGGFLGGSRLLLTRWLWHVRVFRKEKRKKILKSSSEHKTLQVTYFCLRNKVFQLAGWPHSDSSSPVSAEICVAQTWALWEADSRTPSWLRGAPLLSVFGYKKKKRCKFPKLCSAADRPTKSVYPSERKIERKKKWARY